MDNKDILNDFKDFFLSSPKQGEKRFFILKNCNQFYYRLFINDDKFYLDFWIETYADNRDNLQRKLLDIFQNKENIRDYRLETYYRSLGVCCRRPSIIWKDLEEDIKALRSKLSSIENEIFQLSSTSSSNVSVGIANVNISDLLNLKLNIPDYQRAYCWTEENILRLLEDIYHWQQIHNDDEKIYRIGTVILKEKNEDKNVEVKNEDKNYEVIDGQQRIITLALLALSQQKDIQTQIQLGSTNQTKEARIAIKNAQKVINDWRVAAHDVDLEITMVGVVVIGKNESEDLSFNFFNHLNSSGVPLTDYELLKGHHLRYIKEDSVAEIMARRWHSLDTGTFEIKENLLHKCLFRIRKWLVKEDYPANADQLENHALFKEFSLGFEPIQGLCTSYKPAEINSLLSSGIEFFDYVDRFRQLFESFLEQTAVNTIEPLRWHSYGTLYEGIFALAFMFYCKFGDIYLNEAVYAITWFVSRIRNESQVRRAYIGNRDEFRKVATNISRATHEGEVLGYLLNHLNTYSIENNNVTATAYWQTLRIIAKKLQGKNSKLDKEHLTFIDVITQSNHTNNEGE